MSQNKIDIRCREKDYTCEVSISHLPVEEKHLYSALNFLNLIEERPDVSVVIHLEDEQQKDDLPQEILLADSPQGVYMELNYSMDDWNWDHPLLLANDHLDKNEAASVLISLLYECTDQHPIITNEFGEISSRLYPET